MTNGIREHQSSGLTLALQRQRERLQASARRISGMPVVITTTAEIDLTVSPEVAAFATGRFIILNWEFCEPDGLLLMNALCCHELAHIAISSLEKPDILDPSELAPVVSGPWRDWPAHQGPFLWHGHGAMFIRAVLHIAHRLNNQALPIVLPWAFNHWAYGLSAVEQYMKALGDECRAKDWLPLAEALSGPMPAKFERLWTADVLRSLKSVEFSKG